jgi:Tol biopolymer transport system component
VALSRSTRGNGDIWLLDVDRGVMSRFTSHPSPDTFPVWSPDGTRLAFGSPRTDVSSARDLYWKPVNGDEPEKLLLSTPHYKEPLDWSSDGRLLLYRSLNPDSSYDLWALPMDGDRKPFLVVQSNFDERDGQFSPDSRFIAYQSNDSGRWEVYVQALAGGPRVQVSSAGGAQVRWRRDGRELFYIALDGRLMAVPVRYVPRAGDIDVGAPQPLFVTAVGGAVQAARPQFYAVAADGRRFLMNTLVDDGETSAITMVLNWHPER